MRNRIGSCITAEAYQAFIIKCLTEAGGYMTEARLNERICTAYSPLWGKTDKATWGKPVFRAKEYPKWKQNLASAKSGLDRTGQDRF